MHHIRGRHEERDGHHLQNHLPDVSPSADCLQAAVVSTWPQSLLGNDSNDAIRRDTAVVFAPGNLDVSISCGHSKWEHRIEREGVYVPIQEAACPNPWPVHRAGSLAWVAKAKRFEGGFQHCKGCSALPCWTHHLHHPTQLTSPELRPHVLDQPVGGAILLSIPKQHHLHAVHVSVGITESLSQAVNHNTTCHPVAPRDAAREQHPYLMV